MRLHPKILNVTQKRVLRQLGPLLTARGFYLVGGTAVALYAGHRRSVDLDWFCAEGLNAPLRLAEELRQEGIAWVTREVQPRTLHGRVSGVRISLLEYHYPHLEEPVDAPTFACKLASVADLAAMKLAALAQRGAKKDFLDLCALGLRHVTLPQMLDSYRRKFSVEDILHVLYSLTYFGDADRERTPPMLRRLSWRQVKQTMRQWVQELTG